MIEKLRQNLLLILALAAVIGFFIRHEHRMTVGEQRDIRIEAKLEEIGVAQQRVYQHLFFKEPNQ